MKKKLAIVIGALVVIALGVVVVQNMQNGQPDRPGPAKSVPVRVATNIPITGPLAIWGTSIQEGGSMALEELAARPGASAVIKVDWQDNQGDPSTAVSLLQQQYMTGAPDVYVSGLKPQAMAIMDQLVEKGTPNFVWIFDLAINQGSSNNFRTLVSYKLEAPVYLNYVDRVKPKRVAIVYIQLPHSAEEFDTVVVPGLEERGIAVQQEIYDFGHKDFKDIAAKVKAFGPDLIILNGFQGHLVGLVRALRPLGLIGDGNVIGTYDMIDAAKVLAPDEVEGIRVVAPRFETRPTEGKAGPWRERFQAKYGKAPLYIHAYAYDMITVIHDAATRLTLPATKEQWINAISATDAEGITGPLKFDEDGDLMTPVEVGVYRNGALKPDTAD
ncbi:MAG: ABC transporter substrate-binding protein [Lentisphaerae bacterium]|nr:ABC transporter substrate-binding protein [Lentisphaerota bacterium]MBT4815796.1 ABC transporter substrate-binding protein [Lentisphaerota bacterium]MBT5610503.1 ABC transporter substrate-binding protein [Lentisphaerota bacterium]MBT7056058.1 ABC transporter substrate-binding protein [Lentisphaerota bacterium]MBT7842415.1 ABC transporter substrate-binding protein [Lentisphaerota bacterium]